MSTLGSGSLISPAAVAPAPAVEDTSSHWAPHGAALTAFVVGINVLVIVLIFVFFWRFFSGKPVNESGEDGGSLPVASPWASRGRRRREVPTAKPLDDVDVAAALPVYVYDSSAAAAAGEEGGKAHDPECAVCIVELRDGDAARRLPRCGHRFHADCVGAWLRLHATCPLCRASVMAPAAAAAAGKSRNAKVDGDVGADSPM